MGAWWMTGVVGLLALSAVETSAHARDKTYCVGGYTGQPPKVSAACGRPEIRAMHRRWHQHVWVRRGDECFICYDEVDSSCNWDFLRKHPGYRAERDPFSCPDASTRDTIVKHVMDGADLTVPGNRLSPKLDGISPGPYTSGDTVTLRGSVRDDAGAIVAVPGGFFRLVRKDGVEVDVAGVVQPDGSLEAEVTLPDTEHFEVSFHPDRSALAKGQTMADSASAGLGVTIDTCAFRASVVEPVRGASLAVDQAATLRVALTRADGSAASPSGLKLSYTLTRPDQPPVTLQAGPDGSATWTPDASWIDAQVVVSAGGRSDALQVCPGGRGRVRVTELGLGWDTSALPERCYGGLPCRGEVSLVRPSSPTARAHVDALLSDPATTVSLYSGPDELARGPASGDDRYRFDTRYPAAQRAAWRLVVHGPQGDVSLPLHEIDVREPLVLNLPEVLDLGTIMAGTAFHEACAPLDFSRSQAAQEHRWTVVAKGVESCESVPVMGFANLFGFPDKVPLTVAAQVQALDPRRPSLDVCLDVPACAADRSPDGAYLEVQPMTPEFADQTRRVRLTWTVTGRGWFDCHGWWLWPLVTLVGGIVTAYGFVWPCRFEPHIAVRVASSVAGLRRQSSVGLTDLPGSRAGWYRHARLGLRSSGEISRDVRGAAVVITARGSSVTLTASGGIERQNRRTRAWETLETPLEPDASSVYRTGEVYFRVEC